MKASEYTKPSGRNRVMDLFLLCEKTALADRPALIAWFSLG
jgi:hypothetical protein